MAVRASGPDLWVADMACLPSGVGQLRQNAIARGGVAVLVNWLDADLSGARGEMRA
jgi:hypothetical protein